MLEIHEEINKALMNKALELRTLKAYTKQKHRFPIHVYISLMGRKLESLPIASIGKTSKETAVRALNFIR